MIVFGVVIGTERDFQRFAKPGIERSVEADSEVIELRERGCIFEAYNEIFDRAASHDDLEGVLLIHEDVEIVDPGIARLVAAQCAVAEVGVVGAAGAIGVRSLAWWEAPEEVANYRWEVIPSRERSDSAPRAGSQSNPHSTIDGRSLTDVDCVDGHAMAFSPRAVRELRFDAATYGPGFHGYDVDISFEARAAGMRVVVGDLPAAHHHSGILGEREAWIAAHIAFARKWEGRMPPKAPSVRRGEQSPPAALSVPAGA